MVILIDGSTRSLNSEYNNSKVSAIEQVYADKNTAHL